MSNVITFLEILDNNDNLPEELEYSVATQLSSIYSYVETL